MSHVRVESLYSREKERDRERSTERGRRTHIERETKSSRYITRELACSSSLGMRWFSTFGNFEIVQVGKERHLLIASLFHRDLKVETVADPSLHHRESLSSFYKARTPDKDIR